MIHEYNYKFPKIEYRRTRKRIFDFIYGRPACGSETDRLFDTWIFYIRITKVENGYLTDIRIRKRISGTIQKADI